MKRVSVFLVCFVLCAGFLLTFNTYSVQALTAEERAQLEREYDELQQEIAQWEKVLTETRQKKNTLQGDVSHLNAQIRQAEAQIRQRNIAISNLSSEINQKNNRISELEERIDAGKESLAALLRKQAQADDLTLVEIALATDHAFDLFEDVDRMLAVASGLRTGFEEIRSVKSETENEREALAERQDRERDARFEVEVKKDQVARNEAEKKQLLAITQNEEAAYSQVLAQRQAEAARIRARLFPLRDASGIQFGEAVTLAQWAGGKTGVRPALILAILSQESDLGKNVGNCLVTDLTTGDGKGKNTGTPFSGVMKAPRDTVPFERITKGLGLDWANTPVSCPLSVGYGGAMGPTQFIPSTWALFEPRLKTMLQVSVPDPWNAEHAILATALYLQDVGANVQTLTAERNAACRYYSGRACSNISYFYGDAVVQKANRFQQDIDFLVDN